MSTLWIPANRPPQLSSSAKQDVMERTLDNGLFRVALEAWEELECNHGPLAEYIRQLAIEMDGPDSEGLNAIWRGNHWQGGVLKAAAALSMLGYDSTGYHDRIDEEVVQIGSLYADLGGIPDTYRVSAYEDPGLVDLVDVIADIPELSGAAVNGSRGQYKNALAIGSGCTRHYLQQAIAA